MHGRLGAEMHLGDLRLASHSAPLARPKAVREESNATAREKRQRNTSLGVPEAAAEASPAASRGWPRPSLRSSGLCLPSNLEDLCYQG